MHDPPAWNTPIEDGDTGPHNPYAEAALERLPPEITQFALHTDPYANLVPSVSPVLSAGSVDDEEGERRTSPWIAAVSIFLIIVLVLPITAEVFLRLLH